MIDSTISNNTSNGSGGICNWGYMTIVNSTIVNNTSMNMNVQFLSGGIDAVGPVTTTNILNTIIAGNNAPLNPDVSGTFNSLGNNLIGSPYIYNGESSFVNGVNGDKVGTSSNPLNPLLSPLQNNGGSTQTYALLPNSPAKDSGNNCVVNNTCAVSLPNTLTTDQRGIGYPRQVDGAVDIGAYEGFQSYELTTINLPSSRLPNLMPIDIPREAAGATVTHNYIAFTTPNGNPYYNFQATRQFTTSATLDDEANIYLNYLNSKNYQASLISNQPNLKTIYVNPSQTSPISITININKNSITGINTVDIDFSKFWINCITPPSGLVSWYYAEGDANDSIGTNNGIMRNGATATALGPAAHGQAFGFDGIDDYVEIPDSPSLKPQQISVEAWVKFTSLDSTNPSAPGLQYIVSKKNTRTDHFEGYSLQKYRDTSGVERIAFVISSAGGNQIIANSTSPITVNQNPRDQFYHVVGTYDGAAVRLYINGELEGIQAANFPLDYDTRPIFIGSSGEPFDGKLKGVVDEVAIYNRALTPNEIKEIFESGGAGKCRGVPNNPTLSINPTAGVQQETTFTYSGGWYSPNGGIRQFLTYPDGTTQELATLTANSSGSFTAYYQTTCADPIGNYSFRLQDVVTNKQSNPVPITINESSGCFLAQTVNQIEPNVVVLNTRTLLKITGSNFGVPSSASVVTPAGTFNIPQGDFNYISPTEVQIWVNMGGTSAYNAILTIYNIRSSVQRSFKVIPSAPAPVINSITSPVTANQVANLTVNGNNFQDNFKAFIITTDGTFELPSGNKSRVNLTQIKLDVVMKGSPPYNATVKIQNPDGQSATGNFQVIAQNQPPPKPLQVIGIEVTQAVQDLRNSVPLIQDKQTYVRVHVKNTSVITGNIPNVKGQLTGTLILGNNRIPAGILTSSAITVKLTPNRAASSDSFLFKLPPEWTRGTLELQFEGVNYDFDYIEADGSRDGKVQVDFQTAPTLKIKFVSIYWLNNTGPIVIPNTAQINEIEQDLRQMVTSIHI